MKHEGWEEVALAPAELPGALSAGEKRPGDQRLARLAAGLFGLGGERRFQVVAVEVNLAGGDLIRRRAVEAELADAEAAFDRQRRPEEATGHRSSGVEIAEASCRIESGTRLVVGEVVEEVGAGFVQSAGCGIAGKAGRETRDRGFGAAANGCGASRIGSGERAETFAETSGVELRDGKDADAALRAAWSAEKPRAGTATAASTIWTRSASRAGTMRSDSRSLDSMKNPSCGDGILDGACAGTLGRGGKG